jgi:EF hand
MFLSAICRGAAILTIGAVSSGLLGASVVLAQSSSTEAVKTIDANGDGTISLNEAKTAGSNVFDQIDLNHDGVVDNEELGGRVTLLDDLTPCLGHKYYFWKKKGALTKDEYLSIVDARFKPISSESTGTCDAKSLETAPGKSLLELLTNPPEVLSN